MLAFFFDYQYGRKLKEFSSAETTWPAKEQLFKDWGQLALSVTLRNQGTDIDLYDVQSLFDQRTDAVVEGGRACGVLHRSLVQDSSLIRFEHYRAQEYFTARGIVAGKKRSPGTSCLTCLAGRKPWSMWRRWMPRQLRYPC
ncbi:MAG: hypothetical protein SD837_14545 [Candidatus Electrothrix scaldis]|nr:MAG: hypothetical protein SD837_14545 [Candidatus Electrothrix sp. GW3-3]